MSNNLDFKFDTLVDVILKNFLEIFPEYYNVNIQDTATTTTKGIKVAIASIDINNSTVAYRVSLEMSQKLSSTVLDFLLSDIVEEKNTGMCNHLALEILNTTAGLSLCDLHDMTIGTPYMHNNTDVKIKKQDVYTVITMKTKYGNITCYINKIRTGNGNK